MTDIAVAATIEEAERRRRCHALGISAFHPDRTPVTVRELDAIEGGRECPDEPCSPCALTYTVPAAVIIRLPMPPTLTNSAHGRSRHWQALEREKDKYWAECDAHVTAEKPSEPFGRVTLASTMILAGAMDDDGAVARHKWAIDWLVIRRYLIGDRKKHITWAGFPSQIVTRKFAHELILTILPELQ